MHEGQHLQHAILVAAEAHDGQLDKAGNPYFDHCRRVADLVLTDEEKIVAYLHDVVEKGKGWTLDRLKEEGFPKAIIVAVDALTKRSGEDERVFVQRAVSTPLARKVKKADLEDNLLQAEQAGLDSSKYEDGLRMTEGRLGSWGLSVGGRK
ncbi:HD domain-containing protein [Neorhizobium sp. P12A]|uniref:HD domain-containing protein n=1 Tax=Neorhizobium sp. P12A TaxID=2268027 RepID=UPI0011EE9CCA|nr:HD domain-containing protein [Neorhizobium sp. P12A]KAA0693283.1 HD domain-containing protein [Neorhizobium sp. P12A]